MKKSITVLLMVCLSFASFLEQAAAQGTQKPVPYGTTTAPYGFYEYLPEGYDIHTGQDYPVLLFLSGVGEKGNGTTELSRILRNGPPKLVNAGKELPFIIISPQSSNGWWAAHTIDQLVEYVKRTYRVDTDRLYLTGLSAGGMGAWQYAVAYPQKLAAMVAIAGHGNNLNLCAMNEVPVWAFHGESDPIVHVSGSVNAVNNYNACTPTPNPLAKLTLYPGVGHDSWTRTYDGSAGHDVFSWMLSHNKSGASQPAPAPLAGSVTFTGPSCYGGTDGAALVQVSGGTSPYTYQWSIGNNTASISGLTAGTYTVTVKDVNGQEYRKSITLNQPTQLSATGSVTAETDPGNNGKITLAVSGGTSPYTYKWSTGATSKDITNLQAGNYSVAVKDHKGCTLNKSFTVPSTVSVDPIQPSITAHAGSDRTVESSDENIVLNGSVQLENCSIASYKWETVSASSGASYASNSANLSLNNLQAGIYTLRFSASSSAGISDSDDMVLTVNGTVAEAPIEEEPVADEPVEEVPAGQGLSYQYYETTSANPWGSLPDFNRLSPVKTGVVSDFSLAPRLQNDHFAFVYEGYITIGNSGTYTFSTASDDGSKLFINDAMVVDNDGCHAEVSKSGTTTLSSGYHKIRVEFFERGGLERLTVSYAGPGVSLQKIPASVLSTNLNHDPQPAPTNGLSYQYYETTSANPWGSLPDFSRLSPVKTGVVSDFSMAPRIQNDHFAFVYEGYINIGTSGTYTFATASDDGSKLLINDALVVDNDGCHAEVSKSGTTTLSSGYHKIRVEFFERGGLERLTVSYAGPGVSLQKIPASVLSTNLPENAPQPTYANGLKYTYYENNTATRWEKLPDFNSLSPVKSGTVQDFSLSPMNRNYKFGFVYEGLLKIEQAGEYTFFVKSDDGSQLFINGAMVVDHDGLHAATEKSGSISLAAGYHPIRLTFYEHEGGEVLDVSWQGTGFSKQALPSSALFMSDGLSADRLSSAPKAKESVLQLAGTPSLKVYPNPAFEYLMVDLGGLQEERVAISIVDLRGVTLYKEEVQPESGNAVRIDLASANLAGGMYLLLIENQGKEKVATLRFVKN